MILEMTFQVSICSVKAQKHPVMEFVIIVIIIIPPSILLHCEHAAQSIQLCTLGDWHLLLQITCKTYRKYVIRLLSKAVFCFANISTSASILKKEHLPFLNSHQFLHLHWGSLNMQKCIFFVHKKMTYMPVHVSQQERCLHFAFTFLLLLLCGPA